MKKKYVVYTAIVAVLLACVLGGWAFANRSDETPQQTPVPTVSPTPTPKALPEFSSASPSPSMSPSSSVSPTDTSAPGKSQDGDVTVTRDEQGNETIQPNWSTDKLPDNANVVTRQPEANMGGGGGGKMPTDKDGVYRGDHPSESPAPSAPVPPAPSVAPSPEPSSTPAPSAPSIPGGPPSYNGKNGQYSTDGKYIWADGFGWISTSGGDDGGEGGSADFELTGEKVGDMG